MKCQLPDVNVLFALFWSPHQHNQIAQSWFENLGQQAWATNAITQLGVLRLLTNAAVTRNAISPARALFLLDESMRHKTHEFWQLNQITVTSLQPVLSRIRGHKQWTDAALLCQAVEHDGVLVTFDVGIKELVSNELKSHILLLNSVENQVNGGS